MTQVKIENIQKIADPIDIIEDVVLSMVEYERDDNKNIHVQVGGSWCDYQLSYGLNEKENIIYISCALDIKVNRKTQMKYINYYLILIRNYFGHFKV